LTISLPAGPRAARPRVYRCPPYSTSAGQEAIDLARTAGLVLDPWQCDVLTDALAEGPGGKWAAFEVALWVSRQNGKGAILEARELFGLFLAGERLILHTAHEVKTSLEAFRRILGLIEGTPDLDRRVMRVNHKNGEEGIELRSGQRLRFVSRSKGSGRGFTADCVIWDEAQELQDAHVDAQLPTLSAVPNPQLWYTGSPPRDPVAGATAFAVHQRGEAGPEPALCYYDFGAEWGADKDDPAVWAATNPGYEIRISRETIARERRAMTDEGFGRERCGIWPPTGEQQWNYVPEGDWLAALDPDSRRQGTIALCLEMSLDRQWVCICVAGRRADGLFHVEVAVSERGTGWVADKVRDMKRRLDPCAIVVPSSSPAASLLAELEDEEAGNVDVITMSPAEMAQACGGLWDGIAGPTPEPTETEPNPPSPRTIRHRGQGVLTTAIAGAVVKKVGNTRTFDHHAAIVDCSPASGVAGALWAFKKHGGTGRIVLDGDLMA
jgi:hypothetical protein